MKHINFIPVDLRPKLEIPGILIPAGLFLVLSVGASGMVIWNSVATNQNQAEQVRLDAENAELTKKIEALGGTNNKLKSDEVIGSMKKVLAKKSYWSGIFREMSVLIPEGVWLTGFNDAKESEKGGAHPSTPTTAAKTDGGTLLIKGESTSQQIIAQFLAGLEKSNHFAGVQLKSTEKEPNIRPARYKFEFSIPIKTVTTGGGS